MTQVVHIGRLDQRARWRRGQGAEEGLLEERHIDCVRSVLSLRGGELFCAERCYGTAHSLFDVGIGVPMGVVESVGID